MGRMVGNDGIFLKQIFRQSGCYSVDSGARKCIQYRMTTVLSVRLALKKMVELDRRASSSGMERSEYVRNLIEQALEAKPAAGSRRFSSMDLCGRYAIGAGSDNTAVRAALAGKRRK
jgi:hypothetical protein